MTAENPEEVTPTHFLHAGDDRVWCVGCKTLRCVDGDSLDGCVDPCPIQEGDESKWESVTLAQAQEALTALHREMRELDDSAAAQLSAQGTRLDLLQEVAAAARRFCAELQEDAEGVPREEMHQLHAALDLYEMNEATPVHSWRDGLIAFIGNGENSRGKFPTNLSELNDDCREFAANQPESLPPSTVSRSDG